MAKSKFYPSKSLGKASDSLNERNFYESDEPIKKEADQQTIWPLILMIAIFIFLGIRLFNLQVKEGYVNLRLAEGNRIKNIPVPGARGKIVDKNGEVLVSNEASYQLITRISKVSDVEKIDPALLSIIDLSRDEVKDSIERQLGSGFTILQEQMGREEALLIKSKLPVYGEFEINPTFKRVYNEPSLAHVLGYVGRVSEEQQSAKLIAAINGISGKSGIEKIYDDLLQGVPGNHKAEIDAGNRLVRFLSKEEPQIGQTVKTSIDLNLQRFAYARLKEETDKLNTQGALVALDPRDGGVLAMVSLPLYDNGKISSGITQNELEDIFNNPSKPFLNRAVSGVYPSGSTIKPFIASTALNDGIVSENTSFETPPFIKIGQWVFPDWKDHGLTDIRRAIAESNNIFFYALGGGWGPIPNGLGPEGMKKGLEKFGYGKKSGIDLTGEEEGFLPTPEWKKRTTGENWYIGNTYNMAIGQGDLLVTPLQIANATAMIANSGKLFTPHVVSEVLSADKKVADPLVKKKMISENAFSDNILSIVRDGMHQTVTSGSAYTIFGDDFPVDVSAKTGTAQFGTEDKTHAWFTSFAPSDNPEIVISVLIEGGGEGYQTAAPVARDVLKWWNENKQL